MIWEDIRPGMIVMVDKEELPWKVIAKLEIKAGRVVLVDSIYGLDTIGELDKTIKKELYKAPENILYEAEFVKKGTPKEAK